MVLRHYFKGVGEWLYYIALHKGLSPELNLWVVIPYMPPWKQVTHKIEQEGIGLEWNNGLIREKHKN